MVPYSDNLNLLAQIYVSYLTQRDESLLKSFLSLDFVTRQNVTKQLKLINNLPKLLFGISFEIHLFQQYQTQDHGNVITISPFQFDVTYTSPTNLMDHERITLTINSVMLEDNNWKIQSIITADEVQVLNNVIKEIEEKKIVKA